MTAFTLTLGPQVSVTGPDGATVLSPLKSVTLNATATDAKTGVTGTSTLDPNTGVLSIDLGIPPGVGISSIVAGKDGKSYDITMSDGSVENIPFPEGSGGTSGYADIGGNLLEAPATTAVVPSDFTVNGNVYIAPEAYINGTTALPAGLSVDSSTGIVLTDGTVAFQNTINNVGVLCAVSE